jgi:diguanylate cyclase (GGDEF)-like protein/PAS domain S-box-containing protein
VSDRVTAAKLRARSDGPARSGVGDDAKPAPATRRRSRPDGSQSAPTEGARGVERAGVPSAGIDPETNVELAAEALLREHPDALVCGLASNGLIVPIPGTVALWGQSALEGRAVIDSVVAADRTTVVSLWQRVAQEGEHASMGKVRMLARPGRWMTLHFLDLRAAHDVLMGVLIPSDEMADDEDDADELPPAAPRFSTLTEDEGGMVLGLDEAFTQMFGYEPQEMIGKTVLDQIHPDDQARAVEGWLAMLATRRDQHTRLRRRRKDGSWMWVDTTLHNFLNQPDCNHVLIEIIDISAEMAAQEALQEREELLRRLTDAMPVGLLQVDTERNVVYNNGRLMGILHGSSYGGASEGALASAPAASSENGAENGAEHGSAQSVQALLSTLTPEGLSCFQAALGRVLDEGVDQDVEVDMVLPPIMWRRALMSIRALLRANGEVSGAITCVLDITDSARARRELEKRATFDALTRVHNRATILGGVQRELEREDEANTAVIYIDLDRFKPVNDTLGHAAGDELLVQIAERLKIASRGGDDVGRLGGDEFLILLRGIRDPDAAMHVAARIRDALVSTFALSAEAVDLTASIGVAWIDGQSSIDADELVRRADAAMYVSKEAGAGEPVLATPDIWGLAQEQHSVRQTSRIDTIERRPA